MTTPPKQGEPLDPSLGMAKAWWVSYPRVFIFAPPPDQKFTELTLPTGEQCFGFNARELAAAFNASGVPSQNGGTVILNNQIGSLSVREEPGAITPGATRAIDFIFTGPFGIEIKAEVKTAPVQGSA